MNIKRHLLILYRFAVQFPRLVGFPPVHVGSVTDIMPRERLKDPMIIILIAAVSRALRGGTVKNVKSEDLTVGDIALPEAGDAVPADGWIIECASLQIEEAALTGESLPVVKQTAKIGDFKGGDVPLGDRANMAYMGSAVVYSRGKTVITNIAARKNDNPLAAAMTL